jgi:histidyl-tRNA synthetase
MLLTFLNPFFPAECVKVEKPRGTRDLLSEEMERRRAIESLMRRTAESYGYREIQTPTFEHLELFTLKSGEDIVNELYAFKDKSGRDLALRPELTAPVMRLFVNKCAVMPKPLRFYYFSNCFRYERPQRRRYREFWQFGVELIGSNSPFADAEVISLAHNIMENLELNFELQIGHVGLLRYLLREIEEGEASKVMRLIDKKDEKLEAYLDEIGVAAELKEGIQSMIGLTGDRDVIDDVKEITPDFNFEYLEKLCDVLDALDIEYVLNFGIARGLDYYTGVVFEAYAKRSIQICGGGSYELAHLFGGENIPSTGFALGFDRIAELCRVDVTKRRIVAIANTEGLENEALKIAEEIRRNSNASVVVDVMERSLKRQLSYANDINADFVVILGRKELQEGKITLKDMKTGEQRAISLRELVELL